MKTKFLHIIVAFLLLISTLGITIDRHYCGNRLISASIYPVTNFCCNGHCKKCHNETQNIRVTDAFESSFIKDIVKIPFVCLQSYYSGSYSHLSFHPDIKNQISIDISPHQIMIFTSLLQNFRL